ncbi:MAG: quinate 5-dehydrogenase [Acidaminococcaceae bacterium]|nr:quinate 5-dehydrogenase [Acidaminococcaceae bacterium]
MDSEEIQKSEKKKTVISISIGSSQRDAKGSLLLGDTEVMLERKGTDGDMDKAARLLQFYDGKVDAMGLGGTDLYLVAGDHRYVFAESERLLKQVRNTPVLDGSGLKNTLERMAIRYLADNHIVEFNHKRVLLVCAVDRFGMAEALSEQKCQVLFGDIIYGLGCNIPIRSLAALQRWAALLVPIITRLPIKWMYPTGKKQDSHVYRHPEYFTDSDIIAGDFLFIKRFMPSRLEGKTVITNTVTAADRQMLKAAGVKTLVTTTPCLQGRSFGTNVLEAAIVAASGSKTALPPEEYEEFIKKYNIMPSIERFQ